MPHKLFRIQRMMLADLQRPGNKLLVCDRGVGSTTVMVQCLVQDAVQWAATPSPPTRTVAVITSSRRQAEKLCRAVYEEVAQQAAIAQVNAERLVVASPNGDTRWTMTFQAAAGSTRGLNADCLWIDNVCAIPVDFMRQACVPAMSIAECKGIWQLNDETSAGIAHTLWSDTFSEPVFGGWPVRERSDGGTGSLCRWSVVEWTPNVTQMLLDLDNAGAKQKKK